MKSICVIAYTSYTTDARVIRIAESFLRAGFRVDVCTPRDKGAPAVEIINQVRLFRLPILQYHRTNPLLYFISYFGFLFLCFLYLAWRQPRNRYRLVYVNNIPDFLVFSTISSKLFGAKIVLDIHDPMPETYLAKFGGEKRGVFYQLLKLQEKWSAAYSDHVFTVHEPIKRDILLKDGIRADKVTVIANFADGDVFFPARDYSIGGRLRLIYYGTISGRFGLEGVVKSLAGLKRKDGLFLKIIGTGDAESELKKAIAFHDLGHHVDFENRTYPLWMIPKIIKQYHLGIVPYKPSRATNYMLPVKMLELTAVGIPVVTVANTAIKYYFDEGLYFRYDPLHMDTLTTLLDDLIEHPELLLAKREIILKRREDYLWQGEYGKFASLVLSLSQRGSHE